MARKVKASEFSGQLVRLMQKYSRGLDESTKKIVKEVGNEAKKMLRQRAPSQKKKRTEAYRKSLKVKHTLESQQAEFTIYSDGHWQITHLLEFGHEVWIGGMKNPPKNDPTKKKGEKRGETDAIPHFEPVQEWANEEVMKRLEKELKE